MYTCEGTFEVSIIDFFEFILKDSSPNFEYTSLGVPRFRDDGYMEIDFAASSESSPEDWHEKPKPRVQWDNYFKKGGAL